MEQTISKSNVWGGGEKPFNVSYGKMMMWFFLITDALTFSGFLAINCSSINSSNGDLALFSEIANKAFRVRVGFINNVSVFDCASSYNFFNSFFI